MASSIITMYGLLIISACILNAAYVWPCYLFWTVFLYLVPLFHLVLHRKKVLSFIQGFIWGLVFFSIHLIALYAILIEHSSLISASIAYYLLILYFATYSALWFGIATIMSAYVSTIVAWVSMTLLYIFVLDTYGLWIFGCFSGYPFSCPLIPLASHISLLRALPSIGRYGLLLSLLLVSVGIAYILNQRKGRGLLCIIVGSIPFWSGILLDCENDIPCYIHSCAVITPSDNRSCPLDAAQEIAYKIAQAKERHPEIQLFFMPESAYPFELNQQALDMWYQGIPDETVLITGAHRREGKKLFNTVYCIQDSRIIHFYDKKYLFPLTEYIPTCWKTIWNPFLHHKEPFCQGCRETASLSPISVYPFICCEIFFNPISKGGKTIVLCVNDSWFMPYMKKLMYISSIMIALEQRCSIIWVGHTYGMFIDKSGFQVPIFTV